MQEVGKGERPLCPGEGDRPVAPTGKEGGPPIPFLRPFDSAQGERNSPPMDSGSRRPE